MDFETILLRAFLLISGITALLLYSWRLKRRNYFWLRLIAFLVLYTGFTCLSPYVSIFHYLWLHCLFNIVTFLIYTLILWFLYDEKFTSVLFCSISGKCTMHIAEYVSKIVFALTIMNTYLSIFIYLVVYVICYFLFARRIYGEDCSYIDNVRLILFSFIVLMSTDVIILCFNSVVEDNTVDIFLFLLITIVCIVVLFLQYHLLAESKYKLESVVINQLRDKEREQYEISKETINLIEIRQHDIKNMISNLNSRLTEPEFEDIKKLCDEYDLPFKTGNHTIDIILMEKYLVCKNKDIRLECIVDGSSIGFLSEMDIYSLFLNALNNSIESAEQIEDKGRRVIWLNVATHGNILIINIQNYYTEVQRTSTGYRTTKPDKNNHGFGLKSMKMIAEKYNGEMSIKTVNNKFSLGFAIPIPKD